MSDELHNAGMELHNARERVTAALTGAANAARNAASKGTSETMIADVLGISRTTVRKWLGKEWRK